MKGKIHEPSQENLRVDPRLGARARPLLYAAERK
jgi:hypothetical protein